MPHHPRTIFSVLMGMGLTILFLLPVPPEARAIWVAALILGFLALVYWEHS